MKVRGLTTQAIAVGLETCWLRLGGFKVTVTSRWALPVFLRSAKFADGKWLVRKSLR